MRDYHRTKPTGKFFYREYDSTNDDSPIDIDVIGVEALAREVRQTSDFYACGAKRYLHFLTGINSSLIVEDLSSNLNPTELVHRKMVKCLGKDLKRTNDPKETIRKIIASDFYLNTDILNVEVTEDDIVSLENIESNSNLESVKDILRGSYGCTGCHDVENWSEDQFSSVNFPGGNGNIVVEPGEPCNSRLLLNLKGKDEAMALLSEEYRRCPDANGGMPPVDGVSLSPEEILTIYFWILNMPSP